jgi:cyclophilin family peptidyl-prolyl cis-trans isomerase
VRPQLTSVVPTDSRVHVFTVPGKHVVFGRVIRGFDDVVRKIAQVDTDEKDRPAVPVIIYNCGELELRKKTAPPRSFYSLAWKVEMF